jgi:F0F1-type ATP synthase membrane subunit b/b'
MNNTNIPALIKRIEELKNSMEASHNNFLKKLEDIRKQAIRDAEQQDEKNKNGVLAELDQELANA